MRWSGLVVLLLLLVACGRSASAAPPIPPNPPPADIQKLEQRELAQIIQDENARTRESINALANETANKFEIERARTLDMVNDTLRKFKFTLPISLFAAFVAALEVHDLLSKRRERKYVQMKRTLEAVTPHHAEDVQSRVDSTQPPIPQEFSASSPGTRNASTLRTAPPAAPRMAGWRLAIFAVICAVIGGLLYWLVARGLLGW